MVQSKAVGIGLIVSDQAAHQDHHADVCGKKCEEFRRQWTHTVSIAAGDDPRNRGNAPFGPGGAFIRKLLLQSINLFTVIPSHDTVVTGPNHMTYPSRKLIRLATNEVELYDLSSDPGEFTNLAADPARATERAALENMLNKLLSA